MFALTENIATDTGLTRLNTWQDAEELPFMVEVPAGEFLMGEHQGDKFANDTERPSHRVAVPAKFALGKFPVTLGEFKKFNIDYANDENDALPVVRVNWREATAYCHWLTDRTGREYRLPTEAEWEYACRAGTTGPFSFGNEISTHDANFLYDEHGLRIGLGHRTPAGHFTPNKFGIKDMHGNVCEWVMDSWHPNYLGAPNGTEAWTGPDDSRRVIRGGAWDYLPRLLRSSWRDWRSADHRADNIGFRVATSDLRNLKEE